MTENVARLYTAELLSTVEESITAKPRQKGNGIVLRSSIVTRGWYLTLPTLPYLIVTSSDQPVVPPPSKPHTNHPWTTPPIAVATVLSHREPWWWNHIWSSIWLLLSHLVFEATAIHSTPSMCLEVQGSKPFPPKMCRQLQLKCFFFAQLSSFRRAETLLQKGS